MSVKTCAIQEGRDEKQTYFLRKGCYCGVVALICVTMVVVWMVGPIAVYNGTTSTVTQTCIAQPYKGAVCRDVLDNVTLCFNESDLYTYGSTSALQFLREVQAATELQAALKNGTTCEVAMKPYICASVFDLTTQLAMRTDLCLNGSNVTGHTNGSAPPTCSTHFYLDPASSLCKPTCSVATNYNVATFRGLYLMGIFGYVIALITAGLNHRVMRRFPSVLLVYWLVSGTIYNITILINCCTTGDYFDGSNPLACQVQNAVLVFFAYLLGMIPLLHTIILFWGVWFPYYSKDTLASPYKKLCLHALAVVVALAVPCAVCISLLAAGMSGGITSIRQLENALIPFYGICGLIAALVGLTLWKLRELQQPSQNNCFTCTPELKLSAVFIYVVILSLATIARHILKAYRTYQYVDDYFLCESSGNKECSLQPDSFNTAINAFDAFQNFLFSLSPYASLIYILPLQLIQMKVRRKLSKSTLVVA